MLTGLLYAMPGEIKSLLPEGAEPERVEAGVPFYRIRENVVACCGGVGKVNAAMSTQLFIDLYHPARIVNVGVAGCFEDVPIGTLVLADRFMQHDVDTSGIGDPVGLVSTVNRKASGSLNKVVRSQNRIPFFGKSGTVLRPFFSNSRSIV